MITPMPTDSAPRELAHRSHDGLEVTLLWHAASGDVTVSVQDRRHGCYFDLQPERGQALDAFYHPYLHLSSTVASRWDERPLAA